LADFTIGGDVGSFNQNTFQTNLAQLVQVTTQDVEMTNVAAASVIANTRLTMPDESAATTALSTLNGNTTDLSSALGVNVESVSATLIFVTLFAPSPPPPSPPPPESPSSPPPAPPGAPPFLPPTPPPNPPNYAAMIAGLAVAVVAVIALVCWWRCTGPKTLKALKLRKKEVDPITADTVSEFIAGGAIARKADGLEDDDPDLDVNPIALQKLKDQRQKIRQKDLQAKVDKQKQKELEASQRAAAKGRERPKDVKYFTATTNEDGGGAFARLGVTVDKVETKKVETKKEKELGIAEIDVELAKAGGARRKMKEEVDSKVNERMMAEAQAAAMEAQKVQQEQEHGGGLLGLFGLRGSSS